jgi:hypothetical protein
VEVLHPVDRTGIAPHWILELNADPFPARKVNTTDETSNPMRTIIECNAVAELHRTSF